MATSNDRVVSTLNTLIETCRDGEHGFRTAAEAVKNAELKRMFTTYAEERARFASELQTEVRGLGGQPEERGSVSGSLHRGWMNIKSAVSGGSESTVIAEAERGEDSAKNAYEEALRESLPANVVMIVQQQYARVKEAHDRIRDLKRAA